jgi:hypothetical protein
MATVTFEPVSRISVEGVVVSASQYVRFLFRFVRMTRTGCWVFTVDWEYSDFVSSSLHGSEVDVPDDTGLSTSLFRNTHDTLVILTIH